MLPRERQAKKGFFANRRVLTVISIVILILIALPLSKNYKQRKMVEKEIKEIQEEISKVEGKNGDLKKMLSYLESDQFLEEQARLNFGLKKEGEEVAVIKGDFEVKKIEPTKPNDVLFNIPGLKDFSGKKDNNFKRWYDYFFSKEKAGS